MFYANLPGSAKAHERGGCALCKSSRFCHPQDFDYQCPCDWHRYEKIRQALSLETNVRKYVKNGKINHCVHFIQKEKNMTSKEHIKTLE